MNARIVMVLVVVGLVSAAPQDPNTCDYWCLVNKLATAATQPSGPKCDYFCQDENGQYTCCENPNTRCPRDPRPLGDCSDIEGVATSTSDPQKCRSDSECGPRALCCFDNCLQHNTCTDI